MNTTTNETDLPLSDPKHPLHRPAVAKAEPAQAAPAPETKAEPTPVPTKAKRTKAAKTPKPKKVTSKTKADAEEGDTPARRSIVPAKFKARYAEHDGTNGDVIAAAFKAYTTYKNEDGRDAMDEAKLAEVAKANGIDLAKYAKMNNGQKRMNVGNRLRGMLKAGTTVVIGGRKLADAAKALAVQPIKAKAEPKRQPKAQPEQHAAA